MLYIYHIRSFKISSSHQALIFINIKKVLLEINHLTGIRITLFSESSKLLSVYSKSLKIYCVESLFNTSYILSIWTLLETSILVKSKEDEYNRCRDLYFSIFSDEIKTKPLDCCSKNEPEKSDFYFWFDTSCYIKYVKELYPLKFFDTHKIRLCNIRSKNKHISNFLKHSFSNKVNTVWTVSMDTEKINNSKNFKSIIGLSSLALKEAGFATFMFNSYQLKRLIASFRHVKSLNINSCKLSIPKPLDFSSSLKNSNITSLSFIGSGNRHKSDWNSNLDQFINLIKGLGSSPDLSKSLQEINIGSWGLGNTEAQQIFTLNNLNNVKIKFRF
ncbi:unnamed protein product [Moneuplotes crassus]|uniref:Uncharacterized protein n=1 Tax=Euplotes crassus TaxID=5936 RepID=A0AAD1XGX6_EUPCR|nr:unnamed protein product [Moneuplotes crassus]